MRKFLSFLVFFQCFFLLQGCTQGGTAQVDTTPNKSDSSTAPVDSTPNKNDTSTVSTTSTPTPFHLCSIVDSAEGEKLMGKGFLADKMPYTPDDAENFSSCEFKSADDKDEISIIANVTKGASSTKTSYETTLKYLQEEAELKTENVSVGDSAFFTVENGGGINLFQLVTYKGNYMLTISVKGFKNDDTERLEKAKELANFIFSKV